MSQRKQMLDILEEVNYEHVKPKLVKCLAVHNEAEWVTYNLANCYEEFDIIRVVEGAVKGRPGSTKDGHSTDETLNLIRNFPDPDDKIELYTLNRHFKSLEEQKQTFLDVASEDEWIFIVDCDEFYLEGSVDRVRKAIERRPTATEFIPLFLHFYRDFGHIKAPHPEWQPTHQRIIRYQDGLRYHTHPVATDKSGQCTYFGAEYQRKRFFIPNLYIFHYGHARGKKFHEMKREFYQSELKKFGLSDGTSASDKFDDKFVEFMEYNEDLDTILKYDGEHPSSLLNHPSFTQRDEFYKDKDLVDWKDNFVYAAEELPTIPLLMMGPWQQTQSILNTMRV